MGFAQVELVGDLLADVRRRADETMSRRLAAPAGDVAIDTVLALGLLPGDPDVRLRVYRPDGVSAGARAVYWLHSGGMIMGSAAKDDAPCIQLARQFGAIVISADYRLAPEHPHPAPVNDCYAGLAWVHKAADRLSVDPGRIVIFGRSAGGGLAAGVTLMARDRGTPPLLGQVLVAPMLDDRGITDSSREFDGVLSWGGAHNRSGWRALLGEGAGGSSVPAYAAPARAEDLSGLPPAIVQVGELEIFRDEAIAYANGLMRAGIPTELDVYAGVYHGSESMNAAAEPSRRAAAARTVILNRWFGATPRYHSSSFIS